MGGGGAGEEVRSVSPQPRPLSRRSGRGEQDLVGLGRTRTRTRTRTREGSGVSPGSSRRVLKDAGTQWSGIVTPADAGVHCYGPGVPRVRPSIQTSNFTLRTSNFSRSSRVKRGACPEPARGSEEGAGVLAVVRGSDARRPVPDAGWDPGRPRSGTPIPGAGGVESRGLRPSLGQVARLTPPGSGQGESRRDSVVPSPGVGAAAPTLGA